jgi:deazaflavin-dependent oxidoreductase (nitroreductase family)
VALAAPLAVAVAVGGTVPRPRTRTDRMLYGDAHVDAYRRTDGDEGYEWKNGSHIILLTTTGHRSGEERTVPLIYGRNGDDYLVVASRGGSDDAPAWYVNLQATPTVTVQDRGDVFRAVARTATDDEKQTLWPIMTNEWPDYDRYQTRTDRSIPVVVLQRVDG